jgi:hypothetical protein
MPSHELAKRFLVAHRRIALNERNIRLAIERSVGAQRKARPKLEASRQATAIRPSAASEPLS